MAGADGDSWLVHLVERAGGTLHCGATNGLARRAERAPAARFGSR